VRKKIKVFIIVFLCVIFLGGIGSGIFFFRKYDNLRNLVESANAGELQRRLTEAEAALERANTSLAESRESVGRLEEVDQRRDAGIGRIYGIIDDAGKSVIGVASGEQRARIAFEAIARIVDELEAEFGRSPE